MSALWQIPMGQNGLSLKEIVETWLRQFVIPISFPHLEQKFFIYAVTIHTIKEVGVSLYNKINRDNSTKYDLAGKLFLLLTDTSTKDYKQLLYGDKE